MESSITNKDAAGVEDMVFEGSEKLLEISFPKSHQAGADLRNIPQCEIVSILDIANCQILLTVSNEEQVAHLLSESSLFMTAERFLLKTCGKTQIIDTIAPILSCADKVGLDTSACEIFYSHRNFLFPEQQPIVHQSFDAEVAALDRIFHSGMAFVFGSINRQCWNMYTNSESCVCKNAEQTLEIMMDSLEPCKSNIFTNCSDVTARDVSERSGIAALFSDAILSDYVFKPCGYSVNGLLSGDWYFTIHVTPEDGFSYASFETNAHIDDYARLINMVLDIFQPRHVQITLFANALSQCGRQFEEQLVYENVAISGFKRCEFTKTRMTNYELIYAGYVAVNYGKPA